MPSSKIIIEIGISNSINNQDPNTIVILDYSQIFFDTPQGDFCIIICIEPSIPKAIAFYEIPFSNIVRCEFSM